MSGHQEPFAIPLMIEYLRGEKYKKMAMEIAKDLFYGDAVVEKIRKAKSDHEIDHILTTARKGE